MAEENSVIVIKRIKKGGHDHHGGAWKVAYADFVTAMMAFFLLLWLLSATSESQKEGIADYFTPQTEAAGEAKDGAGVDMFVPTIGLKDSKGIGFQGGTTPMEEGNKKEPLVPPGIVVGQMPQGPIPNKPEKDTLIESTEDAKLFEKAQEDIKKTFEEDPNLREFKDNIIVEQTPEGLKIQLVDSDKNPMFESGGVVLTEFGQTILQKMIPVIKSMPNHISVTGHTDTSNFSKVAYTNWELSADRANASRRYMLGKGLEKERVTKVVGMADMELLLPDNPASPRNRRISIILLRGSHLNLPDSMKPAPRDLLSVPKVTNQGLSTKTPPPAPVVEPVKKPEEPATPALDAPRESMVPKAAPTEPKATPKRPMSILPSGAIGSE